MGKQSILLLKKVLCSQKYLLAASSPQILGLQVPAQPLEEAEATLTSMAELSLVIAEVLEEGLMGKVSFICCYPVWWHCAGSSSRKD